MLSEGVECIANAPEWTALADAIAQTLGNFEMTQKVLNGQVKIAEKGVGVAKAVTSLCLDYLVIQFDR